MKRSVLVVLLAFALLLGGVGAAMHVDALRVSTAAASNPSADYNSDPGSGQWYWFRRSYLPCGPPWCPYCLVVYDAYADPYQWYYITSRCDA